MGTILHGDGPGLGLLWVVRDKRVAKIPFRRFRDLD